MGTDKLLAEWFWTDRWIGSSGFLLPMEARGLYREMLTQAWRRGAHLPNDHEAIRRAIGATVAEWKRAWPVVQRFWRVDGDTLVNDTQLEVYAETMDISRKRSTAGKAGNSKRWGSRKAIANGIANGVANEVANEVAKPSPPSPSPSPSPYVVPSELRGRSSRGQPPLHMHLRRLKIWRWMIDEFIGRLGSYAEEFDIEAWIRDRDAQETRVIQGDGWWEYWLSAFDAEVRRRSLPIVTTPQLAKTTTRLAAALANIAASEKV